jgi:hypothetical protein
MDVISVLKFQLPKLNAAETVTIIIMDKDNQPKSSLLDNLTTTQPLNPFKMLSVDSVAPLKMFESSPVKMVLAEDLDMLNTTLLRKLRKPSNITDMKSMDVLLNSILLRIDNAMVVAEASVEVVAVAVEDSVEAVAVAVEDSVEEAVVEIAVVEEADSEEEVDAVDVVVTEEDVVDVEADSEEEVVVILPVKRLPFLKTLRILHLSLRFPPKSVFSHHDFFFFFWKL